MALQLSTASEADIESMAPITYAAFHNNDPANMSSRIFRHNTAQEIKAWRVQQQAASFQDKYTRYAKITDTTNGKLVAYARWALPHTALFEFEKDKESREYMKNPVPKGANERLLHDFGAEMDAKRALHMDGQRDYREQS